MPYRPALVNLNAVPSPIATLLVNTVSIGFALVPKLSTLSPDIAPPFANEILETCKLSTGSAVVPISNVTFDYSLSIVCSC